jgi:hypothetical protein
MSRLDVNDLSQPSQPHKRSDADPITSVRN